MLPAVRPKKGEVIYKAGELGDCFYIQHQGQCKVEYTFQVEKGDKDEGSLRRGDDRSSSNGIGTGSCTGGTYGEGYWGSDHANEGNADNKGTIYSSLQTLTSSSMQQRNKAKDRGSDITNDDDSHRDNEDTSKSKCNHNKSSGAIRKHKVNTYTRTHTYEGTHAHKITQAYSIYRFICVERE